VIRIKNLIPLISFFFLVLIIVSEFGPQRIIVFDSLKTFLEIFTYPAKISNLIISSQRISAENLRLKTENTLLNYEVGHLIEMKNENDRLTGLLDLKKSSKFYLVAAQVIARDPDNWASTVIINKGRQDKVREDAVVIGQKGLVGIVAETGLTTSRVLLVNDPNFNSACFLERSRVQGLLTGSLFGDCRLHFLSRKDDIAVGDTVLTSGLTLETSKSVFPPGLIVGKVKFVGEESSGVGKYCLVSPVEELAKLTEVLIIIP
jgi:rod shape-determining protein MreC